MFNFFQQNSHRYSLAATGIKFKSNIFGSRAEAMSVMYDFIGKNHLKIEKIYDDKHDKTYCCNNDIRFYIIRV